MRIDVYHTVSLVVSLGFHITRMSRLVCVCKYIHNNVRYTQKVECQSEIEEIPFKWVSGRTQRTITQGRSALLVRDVTEGNMPRGGRFSS